MTVLIAALLALSAWAQDKPQGEASMTVQTKTLELRSPAFEPNGTIPKKHTGEGDDISPELKWGEPPQGTKSFALNG